MTFLPAYCIRLGYQSVAQFTLMSWYDMMGWYANAVLCTSSLACMCCCMCAYGPRYTRMTREVRIVYDVPQISCLIYAAACFWCSHQSVQVMTVHMVSGFRFTRYAWIEHWDGACALLSLLSSWLCVVCSACLWYQCICEQYMLHLGACGLLSYIYMLGCQGQPY